MAIVNVSNLIFFAIPFNSSKSLIFIVFAHGILLSDYIFYFYVPCSSVLFKINKFIITITAKLLVEPGPFLWREERLTGQCPALNIKEFLHIPVALNSNVFVLANPLNLLKSFFQIINV